MSTIRQATLRDHDGAGLEALVLARVDDEVERLVAELAGEAPLLARMARYHLGLATADGDSIPAPERARLRGKRVRPLIAVMACLAAGGTVDDAAPLGAAIELLHNFTLIHDDIQDRSPNRRHRPTVWRVWGDAQAINAGDALFAAAQIGLLDTASRHVPPDHLLVVARAFNRMTIDIVRGQVLDIGFEGSDDVSSDAYLGMIRGKTAAIVEFAAWAGAIVGGSPIPRARLFAEFGQALGLGFQVRDDALGAWGSADETGKDTADDIRRRKQSLPVIILRSQAGKADRAEVNRIFGEPQISEEDVLAILALFDRYHVPHEVETLVQRYHDAADAALDRIAAMAPSPALDSLRHLTDRLAIRST